MSAFTPHQQPFDANLNPPAPTAAHGETMTIAEWQALHEQDPDQIPMAEVTFRNYNPGQYICFTKYDHLPWMYGIMAAGDSVDTDDGAKMYPFIYYRDNTQINTNSLSDTSVEEPTTVLTYLYERILDNKLFYFLKYNPNVQDDIPKMIYYTRVVTPAEEMPVYIREALFTAYINSRNGPPSSTNSSRSTSRATSRSSSIDYSDLYGGKRYRKIKNRTKRRNKKSKRRRNNRKSKRR